MLAEIEDADLLREFRVTSDEVGVRTDSAQLVMTERGLSLESRGSVLDGEPMRLLSYAFACASPPRYHYFLTYQYLIPIDESYDEARQEGLGHIALAHLGASDFSIQVDGAVGPNEWHSEFGIVSESEVEPRLRRLAGRMRKYSGFSEFVQIPVEVAPVSFFADFLWRVPSRAAGDDPLNDIAVHVRLLANQAADLVSKMFSQICGSLQPSTGGQDRE